SAGTVSRVRADRSDERRRLCRHRDPQARATGTTPDPSGRDWGGPERRRRLADSLPYGASHPMRLNYTLDPHEPYYDDDTFGRLWDALIAHHRATGSTTPQPPIALPADIPPLPADAIDGQLYDQGTALLGHTVHLNDLLTKAFHAASALEFGHLYGRRLPAHAPHPEALRAVGREVFVRLWVVAVRTSQLLRDYRYLAQLATDVTAEAINRWRDAVPLPDDEITKHMWEEPDEELVRRYRLPDFLEPHRQLAQALAV